MDNRRLKALVLLACLFPCMASQAGNAEFEQWQAGLSQDFQHSANDAQNEYRAYRHAIEQQWQTFRESTQKDWVDYSKDKSTRSRVDFERGEITLETVIPVKTQTPLPAKKLAALKKSATKKLKMRLQAILEDTSVQGGSPIKNQIKTPQKTPLTPKNLPTFAAQTLEKAVQVQVTPYTAKDGKTRIKAKAVIKMIPDHLKVRAERFRKPVETYSKQYGVAPDLVLAVIHTESYFNPKARSRIPAYGLMQLVPKSGGRDAYRRVYGKDGIPSQNFLYQPDNNIKFGTAYLGLLSQREFKRVKNADSQWFLVIASYNTGAGNVSRAFTGKKTLRPAIQKINAMSPEQVFVLLKAKLPYKETRDYLQKVVDRRAIYQNF